MTVYVVDGHGGGVGKSITERIKTVWPQQEVIVVGSNAAATAAMLKAGADRGATGENAVVYCCMHAQQEDVIAGPIGIVLANAMLGEFTPAMARAVSESPAYKVLVPVRRCGVSVAGVNDWPMAQYIDDAVRRIGLRREN